MDCLLVIDENKSYYMYIKDCDRFMTKTVTDLCFTKQRIKTKNTFLKVVYTVLARKMH